MARQRRRLTWPIMKTLRRIRCVQISDSQDCKCFTQKQGQVRLHKFQNFRPANFHRQLQVYRTTNNGNAFLLQLCVCADPNSPSPRRPSGHRRCVRGIATHRGEARKASRLLATAVSGGRRYRYRHACSLGRDDSYESRIWRVRDRRRQQRGRANLQLGPETIAAHRRAVRPLEEAWKARKTKTKERKTERKRERKR